MEASILKSTKEVLGLLPDDAGFDLDVITLINSAFSTLEQLGVGPAGGFSIEDAAKNWTDLTLDSNQLGFVRNYVWLKVRIAFDPPTTSFHLEAMKEQIAELEGRISINRENALAQATEVSP